MAPYLDLIGKLAWPLTALILGFALLRELKGGVLGRIIPPGGSLRYGEFSITNAIVAAKEALAGSDVPVLSPAYAETALSGNAEELNPYELVMTAYSGMAAAVAELAERYGGWNDQRYVWDNIDLLLKKKIIDQSLYDAIRSSQQNRNGVRKMGADSVDEAAARSFATIAYSAEHALRAKLKE